MEHSNTYRRPAFINRPWITGKLYDDLSRSTIMHLDAYVFVYSTQQYLQLEWREGGSKLIALDTWLVEPDGLTPVWDISRDNGVLTYCTDLGLHARVIAQAAETLAAGPWKRVSLLAHYIDARETDTEIAANEYTEWGSRGPDAVQPGKGRTGNPPGRPRKTTLPDIL